MLKVFLDRLDYQALSSVIALPMLVMRVPNHALAVNLHLRPLLLELGTATPAPGLAFLEPDLAEPGPVLDSWAARVPQPSAAAPRWPPRTARPRSWPPDTGRPPKEAAI